MRLLDDDDEEEDAYKDLVNDDDDEMRKGENKLSVLSYLVSQSCSILGGMITTFISFRTMARLVYVCFHGQS